MGKYQFFTTQTIFSDNHFVLKSVENRDKLFLGSFKAKLLRLAQKRKYKKSICAIEINGNSGVVYSLFGTFALDSIVLNNSTINAKLIFDENENKGNFVAKKLDENRQKLNDYQLIFSNIQSETEKEIFNPELTKSQKWKKFVKQTNSKIEKVDDDLDFLLLFFANARNTGFSHFAVMKENIDLERTLQGSQLESNMLNDSVLYIKINSLSGTIFEIDSVFQQAQQYKYKIMDFRGTPGGVIKNAYRIASYLIPDTVEGGIFITRKCYDDNDCIKNPLACDKLVDYDINTDFNVFRNCAGVRVRLIPNKNIPYNPEQKIYILTDNKTASACEPLIYGLRQQKNITIVGEKTAGAILSPIVFDVGGGYYAIIPVAEYLTADGKQIEGKGIEPDVKVKSKKALETVKQLLN
ncbi:hypothetical protein AGMMS50262_07890 [Bacteroidia bacterium]|nr:hypothetical protein AGMMS50262_07890 [Bacteroidia bacterium]